MMLSVLDEETLDKFRSMFYHRAGIAEEKEVIVHPLGSIVAYQKRGWAFDQQLGGEYSKLLLGTP
jgi:hypothetical protein